MNDEIITHVRVGIHHTPPAIWDALTTVGEVKSGVTVQWVTLMAPDTQTEVTFYGPQLDADAEAQA